MGAVEGRTAVFEDGTREDFDTLLVCTGYRVTLPFLAPSVRATLELREEDWLQPVILYKTTWRPELPRMAFIGLYRGPFFACIELQARWAMAVFADRLQLPSAADVAVGLEEERCIRAK